MQPLNVVLLQSDPGMARFLIAPLSNFFRSVREVRSFGDLRKSVSKQAAEVVILDLEMATIEDVERLRRDYPGICIVCNHRIADDAMWTASLNAGAADCYPSHDRHGILTATVRHAPKVRALAA